LTTPVNRHQLSRSALRAVLLLTAVVTVLVASAPAGAAESCGRQVINDWWDGRIDGTYQLHCYDDAIEALPRDVRDYSSAEDDIKRALQAAKRGEAAPPNKGKPAGGGSDKPTGTTPKPPVYDPPADPPGGGESGTIEATPPLADSASSVPVPLLILAGLALLLVVGGSAGYLLRRLQSRKLPPPPAL
jgi:hypothetical protein